MNQYHTEKVRNGVSLENSLLQELRALREKADQLERWIANHANDKDSYLWRNHMELLQKQLFVMREYDAILALRIEIHHMNMEEFH